MARGAAQAQKRSREKPQAKRKQRAAPSWEEQLFFSRLRRHAKSMYILLALVFAVGFVAFGVGSGSTGLSDVLNGHFFGGGGSGTSSQVKDDQKKIARNPKNIEAYLDLAGVYQQDQRNAEAIATLKRAVKVAPNNFDVLNRVGSVYSAQAEQLVLQYQGAQNALGEAAVTPPFADPSSTFAQQFSQDPLTQSLQTKVNQAQSKALSALQKVERTYQRAARAAAGTSNEPGAQLQVANVALRINDVKTAIAAYKRYLKLAPNGPNAAAVRQTIRQLQASLPTGQG
jgi:regulator of sirC expression with transglutaminase-like and TPR domain